MATVRKTDTLLVNTGLKPAEWRRIQRLAKKQDLTAKQLVTRTLRETLLAPPTEAAA